MIRLLFFIFIVLVLGFGFAWLADRPGELTVVWQGRLIEMSLMVAVTAIVSLVAAIMVTWWIVRVIWTSPRTVSRYFRANKRDRGYQALSTGLIAAGAGDAALARKMNKRSKGLLNSDQEPLIHLLDVQAALIEGRSEEARGLFEALSEDPETRTLGLRGLYLEARRLGADEAARHYAEMAAEEAPQLPWAAEATLSNRALEGNWDDALKLVEKQKQAGVLDRKDVDRKKAVLLTARAMDRLDGDPAGAREDGLAALRLAPSLVPAALAAARALFREDNLRKGSKILETAWRDSQNPQVAETYVRARLGDSASDRLKRAQKLESLRPNHPESLFAVARAALEAHKLDLARSKAEAAARLEPRESIYLLLADIEEAETGDQGRIRHWLAEALKAPRDPAWTADGTVSEKWLPASPVTGRLDVFEWKVPLAQLGGSTIEHGEPQAAFERAAAALPPVAVGAAQVAPAATGPRDAPAIDSAPAPILEVKRTSPAIPAATTAGAEIASDAEGSGSAAAPVMPAKAATAPVPSSTSEPVTASGEIETAGAMAAAVVKKETEEPSDEREDEIALREEAFLNHRPDDPGVDSEAQPETKQKFRLF